MRIRLKKGKGVITTEFGLMVTLEGAGIWSRRATVTSKEWGTSVF